MNDWSPQQKAEEESNLVHYLINHVTGKTSGRTDDVCLYDMPHDRYFLGNLRSTEGKMDKRDTLLERELMNKIAPVAFGAEFLLSPSTDKIQLKIMLNWACYYRVFPSFEEQTKHVQYEPYNNNIEDSQTNDEIMNDEEINDSKSNCYEKTKKNTKGRHQNKQSDTLCPKFKKISCKAESVVDIIGNQEHMRVDDSELIKACSTEMSRAKLIVLNDPEAIKTSADIDGLLKIPDSILETSINYQSYLRDFKTSILPEWSWNIVSKLESSIQGNVLSIIFENISPMPTKSFNRESYLFDVRADFEFFQKVVIPFELELAPQGFRYDRMMWGRGFNCEVTKENENIYHTTHNPLYIQKRYDTNNQPEARFDALSKDPIPVLNNILNSMKSYLGEWDSAEVTYELKYNSEWLKFKTEFKKDRSMFESEINRFTKGLKLIESDPDVTLAFYANK